MNLSDYPSILIASRESPPIDSPVSITLLTRRAERRWRRRINRAARQCRATLAERAHLRWCILSGLASPGHAWHARNLVRVSRAVFNDPCVNCGSVDHQNHEYIDDVGWVCFGANVLDPGVESTANPPGER